MSEEQGPDACLCPRNIAAIRDARLKQLIRKHRVDRPAPACLPDDLRAIWNDKEALKAEPAAGHQAVPAARAAGAGCQPAAVQAASPSQSNEPIVVALPPGLPQAEPAAGHQAAPAARAAGAGCQPAAGAGCQPVAGARPHPAPVAADPAPIWIDINPDTAYPGTLDGADERLGGPRRAPAKAPPAYLRGDLAAAPSGAADAAESVDLLNLDDGPAGAGTDAGSTSTSILDGMQALRDGMGALEAALTVMAPAMATKDDMVALKTAMETGFDEMSKRLDNMEEKVQSLGCKVVPEGAAEGAAEDHEGEASGPVCAHSMDADGWRARYAYQGEASEA